MKRVSLLIVVLLLAVGAFWFFQHRGVREGAQLLPADTVLYFAAPDVQRTGERWPKTALGQIGAEPAVAEFLKKPASLLAQQGGLEGVDLLFRVKPVRLFLAVTAMRENGGDLLVGFEFSGGQKELDAAMDRLHRELGKAMPNAKPTKTDYRGDAVTTFGAAGPQLFSGSHGRWGFLSNGQVTIEHALDRAARRDRSASLADNGEFKTVAGHLAKGPDFAWFARVKPLVDMLVALGQKQSPNAVNPKQFAQIEKVKALGGTLFFDGADQREATFVLYTDGPKLPPINRSPMAFASPETTFYYDATVDWSTVASDDYLQSLPAGWQGFLSNAKIDLKQLPQIFGSDLGVVIDWPASAMFPAALAVLEVKDRKRAETLVDGVLQSCGLPTTATELHGARVHGIPFAAMQLIDPAVAIGDKFACVSLTGPDLERALKVSPGTPTLETGKAFKPALAAYRAEGQAFAYLDSKSLFEGIYNRVRPIAIIAAAMSADVGKFVDINKLPETETISRHLSPIVYSNRQLADGWLIESSGPVTLSQVVFAATMGATAGYVSQSIKSISAQP